MTNIAIVVLDTLRKDFFDNAFDWLPGLRFENTLSPGRYTVPAHASLFTGKYPSEIGVHSQSEFLDCDSPTLAESLQSQGYRTRAISANTLCSPINGFDRGFDEFIPIGVANSLNEEIFNWGSAVSNSSKTGLFRDLSLIGKCIMSDCKTVSSLKHGYRRKRGIHSVKEAYSLVKRLEISEREFLFLNIMDAHGPYQPPSSYRSIEAESLTLADKMELENKGQIERQRNAYEDCVRFLSHEYKSIFKILIDEFDYVITLSDHGELFGEYDRMMRHKAGVFPELTHVPLCISGDGIGNGKEDRATGLIDVHQTVLSMAGTSVKSQGEDLLQNPDVQSYHTEHHGLRDGVRNRLSELGMSREKVQAWDTPKIGVTLSDAKYIFEGFDGEVHPPTSEKKVQEHVIENKKSEITFERTSDVVEVDDEVKSQLNQLGYM